MKFHSVPTVKPLKTSTGTPYVYRAVYPKEYIDGYVVKIIRKSGRMFDVFQVRDFGGDLEKCFRAAVKAAKAFAKTHPKMSRRDIAEIPHPKKDAHLPPGIRCSVRTVYGKEYKAIQASWSPKPGVVEFKRFSFSARRRTEAQALALAIQARKDGLATMR